MDEYAAVFQAKIFASGHLFAELPPSAVKWLVFPGFNGSFLFVSQETGRAVEGYWPGYALLLAPFEFFNVPWLCNALLAGLAIYLIYRITMDITGDRRAAGWAMLFSIASGTFWANAISLYSMQAHLTANLLFAWLLLQPTRGRCLAAGVVGSFALILHNPFPHAMFALPWIIALVLSADTRRYLFALILGYLPVTLGVGLSWLMFRNSISPFSHAPQAGAEQVGGAVQMAGCSDSKYARRRLGQNVGLGGARHVRARSLGLPATGGRPAHQPFGAIGRAHFCRVSIRESRSGAWMGISLFSLCLGRRSGACCVCDDS